MQIGARCKSSEIYRFTRENNIGGFEFLRGIPGTLGGLITMNAGLIQYEISQNLLSVITSSGEISRKNCGFAYRKSAINGVILGANFLINGEFDADLSDKIDEAVLKIRQMIAREDFCKSADFVENALAGAVLAKNTPIF